MERKRKRKPKKQKQGLCFKCKQHRLLQKHHCMPQRFFQENNFIHIIYLCHQCHQEIERILPHRKKLTKEKYIDIHKQWFQDEQKITDFVKESEFKEYWQEQGRQQFLRGDKEYENLYS